MLSASLVEEIRSHALALHGEAAEFPLSNGRTAYCFKGENSAERARDAMRALPITRIPLSGLQEVTHGVYCFVL